MNPFAQSSREALLRRVGSMDQLAPVRRFAFLEGRAKSVEAIQCETGGGLAFTALVDRALDLADVRWQGRSLCWRSSAGVVAPERYEREGAGWLRGFGGGMLVTCGLRNVGPGGQEGWETFGLHGEISYLPAEQVATRCEWSGPVYRIEISGQVHEAYPFGPNLTLRRTWRTELGAPWLELEDVVTNEGHRPELQMQLYHWNFGFPFLSERTRLRLTTDRTTPRDEAAAAGLAEWQDFGPPTEAYAEQVFIHSYSGPLPQSTSALLVSDGSQADLAVELSWPAGQLPYLVQWKQCGEGDYVLGIEPSNCLPLGRARAAGERTPPLQPGESKHFRLRFAVLADAASVQEAAAKYAGDAINASPSRRPR